MLYHILYLKDICISTLVCIYLYLKEWERERDLKFAYTCHRLPQHPGLGLALGAKNILVSHVVSGAQLGHHLMSSLACWQEGGQRGL